MWGLGSPFSAEDLLPLGILAASNYGWWLTFHCPTLGIAFILKSSPMHAPLPPLCLVYGSDECVGLLWRWVSCLPETRQHWRVVSAQSSFWDWLRIFCDHTTPEPPLCPLLASVFLSASQVLIPTELAKESPWPVHFSSSCPKISRVTNATTKNKNESRQPAPTLEIGSGITNYKYPVIYWVSMRNFTMC